MSKNRNKINKIIKEVDFLLANKEAVKKSN